MINEISEVEKRIKRLKREEKKLIRQNEKLTQEIEQEKNFIIKSIKNHKRSNKTV